MTTGHRISETIKRCRKRPKSTSKNAAISRKPFGDDPTKILPIPVFIDDYNHYMGGIDQANQLRAAFTVHFSRNQKEFFPGAFWTIDIAISNAYKLNLAIYGSKTTSTGKRDPTEHRNWIEDLVNLLFQVDSDIFGQDITTKPYPKYRYSPIDIGPEGSKEEAFLATFNQKKEVHIRGQHPAKIQRKCFLCSPKSDLYSPKSNSAINSPDIALSGRRALFNINDSRFYLESLGEKPLKEKFRRKETRQWCLQCEKFICQDCWQLYHS
jgi:hypothetical protein